MNRLRVLAAVALLMGAGMPAPAHADIGWKLERYEQAYGKAERGYGKAPEVSFQVGDSRLVVEFDGPRSVAELWQLGVRRDQVPQSVLESGRTAAAGPRVRRVNFTARGSIAAEIHQRVIAGVLVRVDIRNRYLNRIAFCQRRSPCGWWQRLLGHCEEVSATCNILDRALRVDRAVDRLQAIAEKRLRRRH